MLFDDLERGRAAISLGMVFYEVKLQYRHLNKYWWLRELELLVGVRDCQRIRTFLSCPQYTTYIYIYTYIHKYIYI